MLGPRAARGLLFPALVLSLARPPSHHPQAWDLLSRSRAGDRQARHAFAAWAFGPLARFFQNKVGAELDTLDLVSSTIDHGITTAIEPGPRSMEGWLLRLAVEELLTYHRARTGRPRIDPRHVSTADLDEDHVLPPMTSVSPEARLLLEALRRVSLEHQIVLELWLLERLDETTIAERLGVSMADGRRRLWMGKQRLWSAIADTASSKIIARSLTVDPTLWAMEIRREVMAGSPDAP